MLYSNPKTTAIILAGGIGSRMQVGLTKQRIKIGGISILKRSVLAFEKCDVVNNIVVVSREEERDAVLEELSDITKLSAVVVGGESREESAFRGFMSAGDDFDYVAIHDAARPFVTTEMIRAVVDEAIKKGSATLASRVNDTVKLIDDDGKVEKTLSRDYIVRASTPQVFKRETYKRALNENKWRLSDFTDDNMLVESIGEKVYVVLLDEDNPKITTQRDLRYAEFLLKEGEE